MTVFDHREFDRHEIVHFVDDSATGWQYASDADAVTDVLRLSRGMTYKNAIAGLPFGGGKSVILANADAPKSEALFRAFGRAVDSLSGRYITAEDVGIAVDDMRIVREETPYVSGLPQSGDSAGGDPSPWTALGCFLGIEAAVRFRLERDGVDGLKVAVQGVGHVGLKLAARLAEAGADVVVADVNRENLARAEAVEGITVVAPRDILFADVDVLAPCALGNVLDAQTIPRIRASVVAGAANNQLSTVEDGRRLAQRGILFVPDYVLNAGGVISVAHEYLGNSSEDMVRAEIERIPERLGDIFEESAQSKRPTNEIADELARRIVAEAGTADNRQIA